MKNLRQYDVDKPEKKINHLLVKKLYQKYSMDIDKIKNFINIIKILHVKPGRKRITIIKKY